MPMSITYDVSFPSSTWFPETSITCELPTEIIYMPNVIIKGYLTIILPPSKNKWYEFV
jgi:hypothetical protein